MSGLTTDAPAVAPPAPAGPPSRRRWLGGRFRANPVVIKELRGRMRGPRAFIVLTVYLLLMSTLRHAAVRRVCRVDQQRLQRDQRAGGRANLCSAAVVGIELLLVCFIAPAFTAGAISGERERQTYDLLRTTLLSASSLVLGKLASALSYILLLLVAAFPLQSLAFLLGGVAPEEVLIASGLLVATALLVRRVAAFSSLP